MTFAERNSLFLRTAMEVLSEHEQPIPRREVIAEVAGRLEFTPEESAHDDRGRLRWEVQLGFRTSGAAKVGWLTKRGGWSITEAGVQALRDYPEAELLTELRRQFRSRAKAAEGRGYSDPRWSRVITAVDLVGPGNWTTYGDLANLVGMSAQSVGGFIAEHEMANGHRVLRSDGTISPDFRWWNPDRSENPRSVLEAESVEFDTAGHANPAQRLTADDFRELLDDEDDDPQIGRAWLIRGSSVDGRDLIPLWLHENFVSLAAANLRAVTTPVPRSELKAIVEADYQHKSYAAREAKIVEFDAFVNRMRVGDYVLTTDRKSTR